MTNEEIHQLAQRLRIDSIRAAAAANSGHPTSSMSAADLMAVLMARHLHYDYANPENPNNDHLIFSKGHASPLVYAMFAAAGAITDEELLTFRQFGSKLEGHPTPVLPWVDVATGSLGQGMPIAAGVALCARDLDRLPYRVFTLCGDSEMAEGSIWEAVEHAGVNGLDNFVAIIDVNRLGQRGETMHGWDLGSYAKRAEASGWHAIEIDGHDIAEIDRAFSEAEATTGKPTMIVARTIKGYGATETANVEGKHGQPLKDPDKAIEELGNVGPVHVDVAKPESTGTPHVFDSDPSAPLPTYEVGGDAVPTRKAFGEGVAAIMQRRGDVVVIDGEVSNSTHTDEALKKTPERYFEAYIAEQMMIATAVGFQVRGLDPVRRDVRGVPLPLVRLRAHGGDLPGQALPQRLARRRLDRRGRPVADGARGHRGVPRPGRLGGALPVRPQPDGEAHRAHGRPRRHLLPALDARRAAHPLRARRGVHDRRLPRGARVRR